MQPFIQRLTSSIYFERFIISVILLSAVLIGVEIQCELTPNAQNTLNIIQNGIIGIFVIEAFLKIVAVSPHVGKYFKDGWNLFDFTIVVVSLIPFTGQLAMIGRLLRILRVARLISALPELRLIVSTLLRTIPSMLHVVILMSILFYIYGVAGYQLFHETNPLFWGDLGTSLLTLFRIVTLEGWTEVMYLDLAHHEFAWLFYVSFIVVGTFIIVNLFIAIVLNNLDEVKQQTELLKRSQETEEDIVEQVVLIRKHLEVLEQRLVNPKK